VRSGPGRGKRLGVQLVARPFASLEAADCGDDAGTTDVERRRRRLQFGAGCHRVVDEQDPPISRVLALPFVGNGPPHLVLREVEDRDLDVLFEHWPDREAIRMAAFTSPDPDDRGAFDARWARLRRDQNTTNKVVETEGRVVGHIASFDLDGQREVTYWIGRQDLGPRDRHSRAAAVPDNDRGGPSALRPRGERQRRIHSGAREMRVYARGRWAWVRTRTRRGD
jgi:hypothetical protein